jgi:hypothetical protein
LDVTPKLIVVARSSSVVNKFQQSSLLEAYNTKDFLEETGEYSEVSIFQLSTPSGTHEEWVRLNELES